MVFSPNKRGQINFSISANFIENNVENDNSGPIKLNDLNRMAEISKVHMNINNNNDYSVSNSTLCEPNKLNNFYFFF